MIYALGWLVGVREVWGTEADPSVLIVSCDGVEPLDSFVGPTSDAEVRLMCHAINNGGLGFLAVD